MYKLNIYIYLLKKKPSAFNIKFCTFLKLCAVCRKSYYPYLPGTIPSESCVSHGAVSYIYLLNNITILNILLFTKYTLALYS